MIIEINVKNQEMYSQYIKKVPQIIKKYGGKYIVRGGKISSFACSNLPDRVIIIEFESEENLKQCFNSQEYLAVAPLRENSTESRIIIVDGYSNCPC